MPDRSAVNDPLEQERAAEAAAQAGVARLLTLLETHGPAEAPVVEVRARLAVDVARAGRPAEAVYQVDELVRDCRRAHDVRDGEDGGDDGVEHPVVEAALAAQAEVRRIVESDTQR